VVALNKHFALESPHTVEENCVGIFFGESTKSSRANPLSAQEPRLKKAYGYDETASDMFFYGFRYYDPETGRWPNRDPIAEWSFQFQLFGNHDNRKVVLIASTNRYLFVDNSSLHHIDFLGLLKTGNWTGKDWSGGQRPSENNGEMGDAPPVDNQDACSKEHDICWDNCSKNNQPDYIACVCLKSGRAKSQCKSKAKNKAKKEEQKCQKPCDNELVRCNRNRDQSNDTWKNDAVDVLIETLWGD
jgi:RHS repeat-associated protein